MLTLILLIILSSALRIQTLGSYCFLLGLLFLLDYQSVLVRNHACPLRMHVIHP